MFETDWFSGIFDIVFVLLLFFLIIGFIATLIFFLIKNKKNKNLLITLGAIILVLLVVRSSLLIYDFQNNKWFYNMKKDIISQYDEIKSIDFDKSQGGILYIDIYCKTNTEKDIQPIFETLKKYINGEIPEEDLKSSYINKNNGNYCNMIITFYNNFNKIIVSCESSYYRHNGDSSEKTVDNFTIWDKYKPDFESKETLEPEELKTSEIQYSTKQLIEKLFYFTIPKNERL